ncbi:hypothetical protein C8Q76DRAFT_68156 [Earliella scabrosa]|nr:hypothetical protein C8Q76DRAFT_68156 [Earliella scabrosa]
MSEETQGLQRRTGRNKAHDEGAIVARYGHLALVACIGRGPSTHPSRSDSDRWTRRVSAEKKLERGTTHYQACTASSSSARTDVWCCQCARRWRGRNRQVGFAYQPHGPRHGPVQHCSLTAGPDNQELNGSSLRVRRPEPWSSLHIEHQCTQSPVTLDRHAPSWTWRECTSALKAGSCRPRSVLVIATVTSRCLEHAQPALHTSSEHVLRSASCSPRAALSTSLPRPRPSTASARALGW